MDSPPEVAPPEDSLAFPDWQEADLPAPVVVPFASKFGAIFLDQLGEGAEHLFIVEDWYSEGDVSVIAAKSGSGKTFYILHLVMSIIFGIDFFGSKVEQGFVAYQAGEGQRGVKKRLRAWEQHFGVPFSRDTPFSFLQRPIDLFHPESDTEPLIEEIKSLAALYPASPLRMVVIDTLAAASNGADENTVRDMGPVLSNCRKIAAATGAHVALIHHGDNKVRGSTSIYAAVDQVVLLSEDPATKVKTVVLDKQKDGERGLSIQFELKQILLGETKHGKPITSCVCLPLGEKEAIRRSEEQKGFKLDPKGGVEEETYMRAFFEADRKHGQVVPTDWAAPGNARSIVNLEALKVAYMTMSPDFAIDPAPPDGETEEAAAKRKAERDKKRKSRLSEKLKKISGPLVKYGIVGFGEREGEWFCWWTGKALRAFPETQRQPDQDELLRSDESPGF